jgi:hypothetical protein
MQGFVITIIVVLVAQLIYNIWNNYTLRRHMNSLSQNNSNDKNYYELKYQIQYYGTIFTVIVAVLALFGYNQYDTINNKIKSDVLEKVNPIIDSLSKQLDSSKMSVGLLKYNYQELLKDYGVLKSLQVGVSNDLGKSKDSVVSFYKLLDNLKTSYDEIKNKDIVQQNIYVVGNLDYNPNKEGVLISRFKDLKTISGNKLPIFRNPPIVLTFTTSSEQLLLCQVDKEKFTAYQSGGMEDGKNCFYGKPFKYGLIIIEQ